MSSGLHSNPLVLQPFTGRPPPGVGDPAFLNNALRASTDHLNGILDELNESMKESHQFGLVSGQDPEIDHVVEIQLFVFWLGLKSFLGLDGDPTIWFMYQMFEVINSSSNLCKISSTLNSFKRGITTDALRTMTMNQEWGPRAVSWKTAYDQSRPFNGPNIINEPAKNKEEKAKMLGELHSYMASREPLMKPLIASMEGLSSQTNQKELWTEFCQCLETWISGPLKVAAHNYAFTLAPGEAPKPIVSGASTRLKARAEDATAKPY